MERGIRGRLVFAKGRCSSMPFSNPAVWRFRKQRLQVSWLALKTFQAKFDHETFPQSSGVSISWEHEFEIGEGMFENFGLAKL